MTFSTRQVLALMTVAAVLIGYPCFVFESYERRCRKRQEIHAWALKYGFPVLERQKDANSFILSFLSEWVSFSDDSILVELVITDRSFNNLIKVGELKELRSLNLWGTQVTDIQPIAKLVHLELLNLNDTRVMDITPLRNLPNLKCVSLVGTQVLDFSPLASIAGLEKVYISDKQVATAASSLTSPGVQTIVVTSD